MSQRAQDRRWQTKSGTFVSEFGAERLAEILEVRIPAVYQWVKRHTAPTPARACAILQNAAQNGLEISLHDIYQRSPRTIR